LRAAAAQSASSARRRAALCGDKGEGAIGGGNQAARELDPVGLLTVQQTVRRTARKHRCQFPSKIDGVTDLGIHSLTADWTVNKDVIGDRNPR
jgi:hypothetical protein